MKQTCKKPKAKPVKSRGYGSSSRPLDWHDEIRAAMPRQEKAAR